LCLFGSRSQRSNRSSTPAPTDNPPLHPPTPSLHPAHLPLARFRRGWAKQTKLADQAWKEAWLRHRAKFGRWEASVQRRAERLVRQQAWEAWQRRGEAAGAAGDAAAAGEQQQQVVLEKEGDQQQQVVEKGGEQQQQP
jgi:hypothetical protein